jgi:hypothetical protein
MFVMTSLFITTWNRATVNASICLREVAGLNLNVVLEAVELLTSLLNTS